MHLIIDIGGAVFRPILQKEDSVFSDFHYIWTLFE